MGQSPPGETCNETENGLPLLNGPTEFGGHHPDPVQFTTDPRKYAEIEDLLFCVRGSTTGRMNWADQRYAIGRGIAAIRHKDGKEYQPFLKAVVDAGLPTLLASATGSTFPNVSREQLRDLECVIPPLAEQKRIAEVLGALDDKIELNRRINATLEAAARALFQSWFIDFDPVRRNMDRNQPSTRPPGHPSPNGRGAGNDKPSLPLPLGEGWGEGRFALDTATAALFPDSFKESPLGHIPEGWEVCPLSEKVVLLSGGTPKTSEPDYWDGDIPWYSVKDAPSESNVWVIQTEKHVTQLGIENSAAQILPEGTTIISARGTVGKLALVGTPMAMNQSCYGVRGLKGYADYFTYFTLLQATDELQQRTHGTVFDTITRQTFETLDCIFPPGNLTEAFDRAVSPLLSQIRANLHQSRTLASLRDTLLPKLLSGELSAKALQI